jgi:uncharacterized repeat protein (TIGR03803 family)
MFERNSRLNPRKPIVGLLFAAITAVGSQAQTFTTLANFDTANGSGSSASLVQGFDGNFYGATLFGGINGLGTVFKMTPAGVITVLHTFDGADGQYPSGLTLAPDGTFFGTTQDGGPKNNGSVYKITTTGSFSTLNDFDGNYGENGAEASKLVLATDGNYYGTTTYGGSCGGGTVFKVTPVGVLTTLNNFCNGQNGAEPLSELIQGTDGQLYGTTFGGGAMGNGAVYKVTTSGILTLLHSFTGADGSIPEAALVQATNGKFYGTTAGGGTFGDGTVFEITEAGAFSSLYSFENGDSEYPIRALIQANNGAFYGVTAAGGTHNDGTIFEIKSTGFFSTGHNFTTALDGGAPEGALVQATDGNLYGTTFYGGANNDGTVFRLSAGLGPLVTPVPTAGPVAAAVTILGNNLTGTTSVNFNGAPAAFTVVSESEITTTVPSGATTGRIEVVTPGATLYSNIAPFRVLPTIASFTPNSGPPGTVVVITGSGLLTTSRVTFYNRVQASFTVNSDTQVTVTVPAGAQTGAIQVTTSGGTVTSVETFTVN